VTRLVLALLVLTLGAAHAETRRVAVVIGNNTGNGGLAPLRYAELDAAKIGRVLTELGGVAQKDLFLVQGKGLPALEDALRRASAAIAEHRRRGDRVIAIFYYSGHSDGIALELGAQRFTFADLRRWLKDTGADVRLALVDSCKSGALVAIKGGSLGPAFSIRLTDDVSATGEALLTSSAADENALESREIGGSFFTHHLVSALRGAADVSGDGRVTLDEAYRYAYKHTISTSGATLAGPQHPTYDYRLTGQGELVLTELAKPTSSIALPAGFERALVIDAARDQVIAELGRGEPVRVAVVPGRYTVRAWTKERAVEGTFALAAGERRTIAWTELTKTVALGARAKGHADVEARPYAMSFALGGRAGIADELDVLAGVRAGVRGGALRGPSLALDVNTWAKGALREGSVFVLAGYRTGVEAGRARATIALEAGGGAVYQTVDDTAASPAGVVAPTGQLSLALSRSFALTLEAQLAAALLKRDGELGVMLLPAVWLGAEVRR